MLILSRNVGESIIINDDIVVTILGVHRGQVRIGIEAPRDIQIHREEIWEKIQFQKREELEELKQDMEEKE